MESTAVSTGTLSLGTTLGVANTALIVGGAVYFHKKTLALQTENTKVQQTLSEMAMGFKASINQIRGGVSTLADGSTKTNKTVKSLTKGLDNVTDRIDILEQKIDDLIAALVDKAILTVNEAPEPFERRSRRTKGGRKTRRRRSVHTSSESESESPESESYSDSDSPVRDRRRRSDKERESGRSSSSRKGSDYRSTNPSGLPSSREGPKSRSSAVQPIDDVDAVAAIAAATTSRTPQTATMNLLSCEKNLILQAIVICEDKQGNT